MATTLLGRSYLSEDVFSQADTKSSSSRKTKVSALLGNLRRRGPKKNKESLLSHQFVSDGGIAPSHVGANDNLPIHAKLGDSMLRDPCHGRAYEGCLAEVKLMLANRADVNKQDSSGTTSAMFFAGKANTGCHGFKQSLRLLLDSRASVNMVDYNGKSALFYSVDPFVNQYKPAGATNTAENHEERAARTRGKEAGDLDALRLLVEAKAAVDARDDQGDTALSRCALHCHHSVAAFLLESGADINNQNAQGMSPLMMSITTPNIPMMESLVASGADMELKDKRGYTALLHSAGGPDIEPLKVLLSMRADAHGKVIGGGTALMLAAGSNRVSALSLLLEHSAGMDCRDDDGWTALMWSVSEGCADATSLLLASRASADVHDIQGMTPLLLAAISGKPNLVHMLLKAGARVQLNDVNEWHSLMQDTLDEETDITNKRLVEEAFASALNPPHETDRGM